MVAASLKWSGGYLWACKNTDGDVQSDTVAQGYGSLGLMTSVLDVSRREGGRGRGGTRYRDSDYRLHQQGKPTSTNPSPRFSLGRAADISRRMDGTPDVVRFAETLEKVCVDVVESAR